MLVDKTCISTKSKYDSFNSIISHQNRLILTSKIKVNSEENLLDCLQNDSAFIMDWHLLWVLMQ